MFKNIEFAEKLFNAIDDALEVSSAFTWEGSAGMDDAEQTTVDTITFKMTGSALVEHSGDVDGIYSNIRDLRGKTAKVTVNDHLYDVKITSAVCEKTERQETERDPDSDYDEDGGDYIVSVQGFITVKYN